MENDKHRGEYAPAGEESGIRATFDRDEIARAFDVDPARVQRAITGEFGPDAVRVDSRQAQLLAEVLLGDLPQDRRLAAMITLGAFTPRPDHVEGLGEKDPADESDKLMGDINDIERDR